MKIPPVKGTRDFYPQDMARRNWMIDGWKKVSLRNGFEEYDGPIFEYLKMFQLKSGDEIVEQLFSLTDRGGRDLALRPEITPTMARMINQQISSLPKPIKWFSVPRLFRAERPQRGRLREFFQWNVDIIGTEDALADAETIFCALDYLQEIGLTPDDIVVKISSRKTLAAVLKKIGIPQERLDSLYTVLDKKNKLPPDTFDKMLNEQVPNGEMASEIQAFMEAKNVSELRQIVKYKTNDEIDQSINEQEMLIDHLARMGVSEYCQFDPSVVRGLAYYTGIVYEIYDRDSQLRAIGGGGRYDNLLQDFGGPAVTATGFGLGDCVLSILLEEKGLLEKQLPTCQLDYFVACIPDVSFDDNSIPEDQAVKLIAMLRRRGLSADFSYKFGSLSNQLKQASERKARKCIIIAEEFKSGQLVVKDMATGEQDLIELDNLFT
jgi:histidyl-tRNA synthetase